jgi:diacylglycerol O-acyltransferase / wax synthase
VIPADNRLAFIDQASFLGLRALGQKTLVQCTWVYNRAIDIDGLKRFDANLRRGLMGRRIERSPLPFGRHRWVAWRESPGVEGINVDRRPRSRADIGDWADERARLPIDPESGPAWHLGVLPLHDGAAAVTLVASHSVVDGLGLLLAIADASNGVRRDLGYPPPRARTRRKALREDARMAVRGMPEVGRALIAGAKLIRRGEPVGATSQPLSAASQSASAARADGGRVVEVPSATVYIGVSDWDLVAKTLGGTSNSLVAGFMAKLAQRVGRVNSVTGAVTLSMPVSERGRDDFRANALTSVTITVDPTRVATDLRELRGKTKQALAGMRDAPNKMLALLPLTPFVPKVAARRLADVAFGYDDLPVGCSNLGDLNPAVSRADGTEADYVSLRLVEQGVTNDHLERTRGQLFASSGRAGANVFISVVAYQLDRRNSKPQLRELVSDTLAEFGLAGTVE